MPPNIVARQDRRYQKSSEVDNRNRFQRDRDRVLYSAAWRRLGHVTQVVSPTEGIVFHNRLTHTLEVAQVGRRIAERFENERVEHLGGVNPDVVETAALVHDLGHPPYGHAVETELNRQVSKFTHDGYEGNAQSFRIVTKLARRRLQFEGLDLTRASLNAALKYPWTRAEKDEVDRYKNRVDRHKKWGVYSTELEDYYWAREIVSHSIDKKCIEAEIMDWADDVAYAIHDVEDFYRAGLIPLERFIDKRDPEVERFAEYAEGKLSEELSLDKDRIKDILLRVTKISPTERPYSGSTIQRAGLKALSSQLISDCVRNVSLANTIDDEFLLKVPESLRNQVEVLKQLTWLYVIDNRAIKIQQHGQRRVVKDLFEIYFEATGSSDSDLQGVLPESHLERLEDTPDETTRARVVADLISSMTERQLLVTHRKLAGIDLGSITDLM